MSTNRRFPALVVLAILSVIAISSAQTLTITSPKAGGVYYVGDTLAVTFSADQAFIDKMSAKALMLDISPDGGVTYCIVVPLGKTVKGPSIPVGDPLWGNARVIITDSLVTLAGDGSDSLISSLSGDTWFKLYDYGNGNVCKAEAGPFTIRKANEKPVPAPEPEEKKGGCGGGSLFALFPAIWLRRRKIMAFGKGQAAGLLVLVVSCIAFGTPGCTSASATIPNQIAGSWTHTTEARSAIIRFDTNGTYSLQIDAMNNRPFPGTWRVDSGCVVLTDTYCGTRLPGKYKVNKKNNTLVFTLVEDKFCDRNLLFPGVWGAYGTDKK